MPDWAYGAWGLLCCGSFVVMPILGLSLAKMSGRPAPDWDDEWEDS